VRQRDSGTSGGTPTWPPISALGGVLSRTASHPLVNCEGAGSNPEAAQPSWWRRRLSRSRSAAKLPQITVLTYGWAALSAGNPRPPVPCRGHQSCSDSQAARVSTHAQRFKVEAHPRHGSRVRVPPSCRARNVVKHRISSASPRR
jgi:hypothetical protein